MGEMTSRSTDGRPPRVNRGRGSGENWALLGRPVRGPEGEDAGESWRSVVPVEVRGADSVPEVRLSTDPGLASRTWWTDTGGDEDRDPDDGRSYLVSGWATRINTKLTA